MGEVSGRDSLKTYKCSKVVSALVISFQTRHALIVLTSTPLFSKPRNNNAHDKLNPFRANGTSILSLIYILCAFLHSTCVSKQTTPVTSRLRNNRLLPAGQVSFIQDVNFFQFPCKTTQLHHFLCRLTKHMFLVISTFAVRSNNQKTGQSYHNNSFRVNGLRHNIPIVCDIFYHFIETCSLHLFELQVTEWVSDKIKEDTALPQLLYEEFFPFVRRCIWEKHNE